MADIFDANQYKAENNRITLMPEQKRMIKAGMYQAYGAMKKNTEKSKKITWVKGIAAALAVALIGGGAYLGFGISNKPDNWFVINVSAASASDDESAVGATFDEGKYYVGNDFSAEGYSQSTMTGFFMEDEEDTLTKDGYKDYFAYYHMENFGVEGANIKSVKFESNKNGIYFTLTPDDNTLDYLSGSREIDIALADYKERNSLDNSQYSFDELRDKAPWLLWPCDGFRYDNDGKISTGEEDNILPVNHIDIILESDHSDAQIAKWVKEAGEIENTNYANEKYDELGEKIQQKMLQGAQVKVTVTYEDNSTETKLIDLVYTGNRNLLLNVKN